MATTYKVLGQVVPVANTFTTLYTAPSQAVVSTLNICNLTASNVTFRAAVRPAGATIDPKHYIAYDTPLPAQDAIALTIGISLGAADVVTAWSTQGNVAFSLFGSEIS